MADFRFTNEHSPSGIGNVIDVLRRPRLWIPTAQDYPGHEAWLGKTEAQLLSGEKRAMLAYMGLTPVGAVVYRRDEHEPNVLEIRNISISPEIQGRYFGSFLLRNSEIESANNDYPDVTQIKVDTKIANKSMINFLISHGYELQSVVDLYSQGTGMDAVLAKSLS